MAEQLFKLDVANDGDYQVVVFRCPGCTDFYEAKGGLAAQEAPFYGKHHIYVKRPASDDGLVWGWNGNIESPTIVPSYLIYESTFHPRCHSFIKNGRIEYCGDCTHGLSGQTVFPLPFEEKGV